MKNLLALFFLILAAQSLCAEAPARADPLKGKPPEHWIARLGSDSFAERDEATKLLAAADESIVPALKKALQSSDAEVRTRAQLALNALITVSLAGDFVRISSESFDPTGTRTVLANEAGDSSLKIESGRLVFKQSYNKGVEQIYSFPETTPLKFRNTCAIGLAWESINANAGYNPDRENCKIECVNTEAGVRITFSAKDTSGTFFKMVYATAAAAEKIRAREGNPIKP